MSHSPTSVPFKHERIFEQYNEHNCWWVKRLRKISSKSYRHLPEKREYMEEHEKQIKNRKEYLMFISANKFDFQNIGFCDGNNV